MKSKMSVALASAVTAAAVAAAFGFVLLDSAQPILIFNEADSVDSLRSRLINLNDRMQGIRAAARLDGDRALTEEETETIESAAAEFEALEARLQAAQARERTQNHTRVQLAAASRPQSSRASAPIALPQRGAGRAVGSAGNHRTGLLIHAGIKSPAAELFGREESPWKSGEFFHAVANRMVDPRLIQDGTGVESYGTDGGYAVPPDFYRGTIDQAMQTAELAPRCRLFGAVGNTLIVPLPDKQYRANGLGIAGLKAMWAAENTEQSAWTMRWRAVELKLHKIFVLGEASSELLEDGVGYETQLSGSMSEATSYALDAGILHGTGVGQPLGIIGSPSAIQITPESGQAADTVLYENLVNAYARLAPACQKRAVWFMSPNVLPQLLVMKFPGSDNPVLLSGGANDAASGAPAMSIFGRPVVITEIAPALGDAGDIAFADLSQYALLMKRSARLEADGGPGFTRDAMTWRMILRVTGQPMWDEPITPYSGGPTLSWATYLGARA